MPVENPSRPSSNAIFCRNLSLLWTCKPFLTTYFCITVHTITVSQRYMANVFTRNNGKLKPSDIGNLPNITEFGAVASWTQLLLTSNSIFYLFILSFSYLWFPAHNPLFQCCAYIYLHVFQKAVPSIRNITSSHLFSITLTRFWKNLEHSQNIPPLTFS